MPDSLQDAYEKNSGGITLMYMIRNLLILICCMPLLSQAQSPTDSLAPKPSDQILHIPSANQLLLDNEKNLYLLDTEGARMYKYFAATKYDSSIQIGGLSHREEGFLYPVKMSLPNRQTLYVLDEADRKLSLFNPNFKVLESMHFLFDGLSADAYELQPHSFAVNGSGEIFLLNQLDNRIVKINAFGETETRFGGLDYGSGTLYSPNDIAVDDQNNVFVSDQNRQELKVYGPYGQFLYSLQPDCGFEWTAFQLSGGILLLWSKQSLYLMQLASQESRHYQFSEDNAIRAAHLHQGILYLLTENAVNLYQLMN